MNVKREDLIRQLVQKHNYTKKAAKSVVDDFTGIIVDNMRAGNSVSIYGFGCFDILKRAKRTCPNVLDGITVEIPEHWVPRFYAGDRVRRAVKMWESDDKAGNG